MAKNSAANTQAPDLTPAQLKAKASKAERQKALASEVVAGGHRSVPNPVFDTLGASYKTHGEAVGAASRISRLVQGTLRISQRGDGSFGIDLVAAEGVVAADAAAEATLTLAQMSALVYVGMDKGPTPAEPVLVDLEAMGLVHRPGGKKWKATERGLEAAKAAIQKGLDRTVKTQPASKQPTTAAKRDDTLMFGKYPRTATIRWVSKDVTAPACYLGSPTVEQYVPRMPSVKDAGMRLYWDLKRGLIKIG